MAEIEQGCPEKDSYKWIAAACIIALTLLYIWSNSLPSIEQSNQQSGRVLKLIEAVFNTPPLDTEENQHVIRKIAHVVEFGALGLEMAILLFITGAAHLRYVLRVMLIGLMAASIDEVIQMFSQRGSQAADVALDFMGVMLGICSGKALQILLRRTKARSSGRNSHC